VALQAKAFQAVIFGRPGHFCGGTVQSIQTVTH